MVKHGYFLNWKWDQQKVDFRNIKFAFVKNLGHFFFLLLSLQYGLTWPSPYLKFLIFYSIWIVYIDLGSFPQVALKLLSFCPSPKYCTQAFTRLTWAPTLLGPVLFLYPNFTPNPHLTCLFPPPASTSMESANWWLGGLWL